MLMNLVRQSTARPALRAPGFVGVTCGIGLAAAVLFVSFPGIDFAVTNPFHVGKQAFLFNFDGPGKDLRRVFKIMFWAAVAGSLVGLLATAFSQHRPFGLDFPKSLYLVLSFVLAPGVIANVILKDTWGRARPFHVTEYGGTQTFTPALMRSDQCVNNCSFVSGEAAAIYALFFAIALLATRQRGRLILLGIAGGTLAGFVRIAQGGHFISDVVFAGVFMALAVRLVHWLVFELGRHALQDGGPVHGRLMGAGRHSAGAVGRRVAAARAYVRDRAMPALRQRLQGLRWPASLDWLALRPKPKTHQGAPGDS